MNLRIQDIETQLFFDLSPDDTLPIDINSSLFNPQDDFLGSLSYEGNMPLKTNQRIIRNQHYINTAADKRKRPVLMWLEYLPWKQADMFWTVQGRQINYNLYIDSAIIANEMKTTKMNRMGDDIDDQVNNASTDELKAYMMAAAAAAPGTYPMTFFPFKNDGAYNDAAYVSHTPYSATTVYGPGNVILFTNNRVYQCTATTVAGMDPIDWLDTQTVNVPQRWTDITTYPDIALPVSKIMNRWELDLTGAGSFKMNGTYTDQTIVPAFYLVYILKRIAHYFGYDIQGKWLTEADANKLVVLPNYTIVATVIPDYTLMMPNMLVGDFLKSIRNRLGLLIDFDQRRNIMTVESLANLVSKSAIVDLQQYQLSFDTGFRETSTETEAWIITQKGDSGDKAWDGTADENYPTLQIGDPTTAINVNEIELSDVATKMIIEQSAVDKAYISPIVPIFTNWRIPWIKQPIAGATPLDQVSSNSSDPNGFGLRLLYYHGMTPDDGGYPYPYASSDNKDVSLNPIVNYTLDVSDNTGTKNPTEDYYDYQLASKPFEMDFELPPRVLTKIYPYTRIVCCDDNNAAVMALMGQISADVAENQKTIPAKLTLWPIIQEDNTAQITGEGGYTPPPPPPDNGTVWAKLDFRNVRDGVITTEPPPERSTNYEDIYVMFYADEAMTTPKDVTGLVMRLKTIETDIAGSTTTSTGYANFTITSAGHEALMLPNQPTDMSESGLSIHWEYSLGLSALYNII